MTSYFEVNGSPMAYCPSTAGKVFEEGWRVDVKHRASGSSAGTVDVVCLFAH